MRLLRAAAMVFAVLGLWAPAHADPVGTWLTEGGASRVKVVDCGGALCATIIWLKEPNDPETGKPKTDKNNPDAAKRSRLMIGVPIIMSMKPNGPNKWSGNGYSPKDGRNFTGSFTEQGPNSGRLEGCALGGLICKGESWTRAN